MTRWTCLALCTFLVGCASPPVSQSESRQSPETAPFWPADPTMARIKWSGEFSEPRELGYKPVFLSRLKAMVGGAEELNLLRPYAIDADEDWLIIADPGASRVVCMDKKRRRYQVIGDSDDLQFGSPVGVAIAKDSIYVADSAWGEVYQFDSDLQLERRLDGMTRPTALAYDHLLEQLFVADTGSHTIRIIDGDGRVTRTIGKRGTDPGEFNYPSHIALTEKHLLVVDAMNFRVQVFTKDGDFVSLFGVHGDQPGQFAQPKGIASDQDGNIYVSESVSSRVQIFDLNGSFLMAFGFSGNIPGGFLLPAGIHIEGSTIYVADSGNGRIQTFQYLEANTE